MSEYQEKLKDLVCYDYKVGSLYQALKTIHADDPLENKVRFESRYSFVIGACFMFLARASDDRFRFLSPNGKVVDLCAPIIGFDLSKRN